jgi:hypothetical protein
VYSVQAMIWNPNVKSELLTRFVIGIVTIPAAHVTDSFTLHECL